MATSSIEWTNATWNPVTGCDKISAGCKFCYAERMSRVNSMSDLFHKDVPTEYIQRVFDIMRRADWHQFQILTKRGDVLESMSEHIDWPRNVWMGVSVENQKVVHRIDIRDQCTEACVPFFFKQWGGINKKATGRKRRERNLALAGIMLNLASSIRKSFDKNNLQHCLVFLFCQTLASFDSWTGCHVEKRHFFRHVLLTCRSCVHTLLR